MMRPSDASTGSLVQKFGGGLGEDYEDFVMAMQLYYLSHKEEDRVLLGPRIVLGMQGEMRKALAALDAKELTKPDGWKIIDRELKARGYKPNKRRMLAATLREYFRLRLGNDTYFEYLVKEDNSAKKIKEYGFEIQEEIRGYFVLEGCKFSDEQKAAIQIHSKGSLKISDVQTTIRDIYDQTAKGTA